MTFFFLKDFFFFQEKFFLVWINTFIEKLNNKIRCNVSFINIFDTFPCEDTY